MAQPTRQDVVEAAWQQLRADGPAGLSMRRLADTLGVSFQVVYSRIGGKADVVRALHDDAFASLSQRWLDEVDHWSAAERIHRVAALYVRHAEEDPLRFAVMFGRPIEAFERDEAARGVEWRCFRATWVDASEAWLAHHVAGTSTAVAVRLAWRLWTAVHGITTVHLAGHLTPSGDVEAEVGAVLDLLLADPSAASAPAAGS